MTSPVEMEAVPENFRDVFTRWFFWIGRFLLVFWAVTIVNTIAWELTAGGLYDSPHRGLAGYWEPGRWVHGRVENVAKVVHHRPISEPDTIKAGWTQTQLFRLWLAMFLPSLAVSFWLARQWTQTVSVVEWIYRLMERIRIYLPI